MNGLGFVTVIFLHHKPPPPETSILFLKAWGHRNWDLNQPGKVRSHNMERAVNSNSLFDSSTAPQSLEISSSQSVLNYNGMKKSRRLTIKQVRALERSFQLENMVESWIKEELARALGLHPRQIAVWFQNRRARWKTKQLEKDFSVLKQEYESFKTRYHTLLAENQKLQSEVRIFILI